MSRDAVLGSIRRGLKRGPVPADQQAMRLARPPRHLIPARSPVGRPEQVLLFIRNVEQEFGTVDRVAAPGAVPGAVAAYLAGHNLPGAFVMAPHPELQALPWRERPLRFREGRAEATDLVSVQHAFAGVAETGTLVLPSGPQRPATLNLLPDTAIAVLRASRIVESPEDAWDLLRAEHPRQASGGFMPRDVMLVTGPSRSAETEQTAEPGAHGPRRLHVVLIDDDPQAMAGPCDAPAA